LAGLRQFRQRVKVDAAPGDVRARPHRDGLTFAPWPLPPAPARRAELRVAVILDDFSAMAFGYEWTQVRLTPQRWREQMDGVHLLFVESAWAGNEGAWRYQLTGTNAPGPALVALLGWCRAHGVPTVFWNKEDPIHYEDFLGTALLFDHVLTTDGDLVETYRTALGHDRVGVLPFAAQPAVHHPMRSGHGYAERDVAFAGMYFAHRHAERREQMDLLLGAASRASGRMETGLEIFSRQLGGESRYQFPPPLSQHVAGRLDYPQVLTAYRAYKVFCNVNTVVGSSTMCARRVYEITACGTPVVSTPSPAITAVFGDDVPQVANTDQAEATLRALVTNRELRDRMVHRAQRKIWAAHTYSHRVDQVLDAAGIAGHRLTAGPRAVSALVSSNRPHRLESVLATVTAQKNVEVQLVFVAHGWDVDSDALRRAAKDAGLADAVVLQADKDVPLGECLNRAVGAADAPVVAKVDDDDVYGEHYLFDQLAAMNYSGADVVGKHAHFVYLAQTDVLALQFAKYEHRFSHFVAGPTIVARRDIAADVAFPPLRCGEDTGFLSAVLEVGGTIYSADRFGFVKVRDADVGAHTWAVSDAQILATAQVQGFGRTFVHAMA